MILLCPGQVTEKCFEALLLFAGLLKMRGHGIAIDARFIPEEITQQQKFEIAPFLADGDDITPKTCIVIAADTIDDKVQGLLHASQLGPEVAVWAIGRFASRQGEINARNKIAYAIGREAELLNLAKPHTAALLEGGLLPLFTIIDASPAQELGQDVKLMVSIPFEALEDPEALKILSALNYKANVDVHVLTSGKGKDLITQSRHSELSVFKYNELPPANLVDFSDILVFFDTNIPNQRLVMLALTAMGAGKVVIDCTTTSAFVENGAPVLKGPAHLSALSDYLGDVVLPNRSEIGRRIQNSDWLKAYDIEQLENALLLARPKNSPANDIPKTLFFPTNGNGLGHAQRCAVIAEAMTSDSQRSFAAFPSCINLLQTRGFACTSLVSRSDDHTDKYSADLLNYLRLLGLLKRGDQLVFDGGYVFDSIYRAIAALQISSVWIRRGLWRPNQIHQTALERERIFSKVIVPTEAFAELNADYSSGARVHSVGPIVRGEKQTSKKSKSLRERLSIQFDRPVETLVVTMLGGGVASERTAQTQVLCSILEARPNCLHLVVAWPSSVVAAALYGWKNSHVVHTSHTQALCQAADLVVSAVGYNSFHEIMYTGAPAIFIPQSAAFLDDQEKRACAASERGLAALVLESEMLLLEREVRAFLDEGKAEDIRAALKNFILPEPGNRAAAELIEGGLQR